MAAAAEEREWADRGAGIGVLCGDSPEPAVSHLKPVDVPAIYESNMRNIPAMLRKLAEQVENGDVQATGVLCIIELPEAIQLRGWGKSAQIDRQALLALRAGEWLMWQAIPPVDAK